MYAQDLISILWIIRNLRNRRYEYSRTEPQQIKQSHDRIHSRITPPRNNLTSRRKKHNTAYLTNHSLSHKSYHPASDLKNGWIIDSGASAHMTPFKSDCDNIQPTYRQIYLAEGSLVLCKEMGTINIPIKNNKTHIGNLRMEDVLIVPNLDRRLFSVNSFLSKGQNWVHFNKEYIELGIHEGPAIKIPITSF